MQNNLSYGIYAIGNSSLLDISANEFIDNGQGLTLNSAGVAGAGIYLRSQSTYPVKFICNGNSFISRANEAATSGQLYGLLLADEGGGVPKNMAMKNNNFIFFGTYSTPYPDGNTRPVCVGINPGGGTVALLRDIIGDPYGNTCNKAPQQETLILNSPNGTGRFMGYANSIPSSAFPAQKSKAGDIYYSSNIGATIGSPTSWICTVSGTPGTYHINSVVGG